MTRALACAAVVIAVSSGPVLAHEWYSDYRDPVWGNSCCGGSDCAPLDSRYLSFRDGLVHVEMTAEQARTINPRASNPINATLEPERTLISEDGRFHLCVMPSFLEGDRRQGVYCIFVPPAM